MYNYLFINSKFGSAIIKETGFFEMLNNNKNYKILEFNEKDLKSISTSSFVLRLLTYIQIINLIKYSDVYRHSIINNNPKSWFIFIVALFLNKILSEKIIKNLIKIHDKKLLKIINHNLIPDDAKSLIIISGIYAQREFNILRLCKNKKIKSYFVIDNWDNLSTKMPFIEHPDEIILWGDEMNEIWNSNSFIKNNKATKVHILGSYRYSLIEEEIIKLSKENFEKRKLEYFSKSVLNINDLKKLKIIVFADCIRDRDPNEILKILDQEIELNFKNKILIIFREHPLKDKKINISKFKNIYSDPAFRNDNSINFDYKENIKEFILSKTLIYSDAVISQLSTILIEIDLLKKKKLVLTHGSPQKQFERMRKGQYFKYYLKKNKPFICDNKFLLKDIFKNFCNEIINQNKDTSLQEVDYDYIYKKNTLKNYIDKFSNIIEAKN